MCGINGFTWHDPSALRRMHAATRHRGPDDEGFFEQEGISFAHNRLAIIDLSPGGRQPMTSPDGRYTIVFNGEIYNYRQLKKELEQKGETFTSSSDTEVLLAAFARWGEACLPRLNGIFAFAVWDRDQKKLTLVRDQIGVKPLYYHWDGKRLAFSSEIKALLELGISRTVDPDALNAYFRLLYVPAPRTMFRDVKKLRPGHMLTVKAEVMEIRQWWRLQEGSSVSSREEAIAGVRTRVQDAVRRQLISDRPLGVFLSGGIDSTAIVAMMREIDPSGTIKTFTMGYEQTDEAEKYNADSRLAKRTSNHFGTEHREHILTSQDVLGCLDDVAWHMDEPVANHIQTSTYLLAKFAKPDITVALGGDGGDELFGGYPRYWHLRGWRGPMYRFIAPLLGRPGSLVQQRESSVSALLASQNDPKAVSRMALPEFHGTRWTDRDNQMMAKDIGTWIPDESLVRTDKLTMAHGLEERVPLLDPELVSYALRIPSAWKIGSRSQGKRILIDAIHDLLPAHVLHEEKRAWMSPMAKWIRGPLQPFVREALSPAFGGAPATLVNFAEANRMLDNHISKRRYALAPIWSVVTLQLWWKRFRPAVS